MVGTPTDAFASVVFAHPTNCAARVSCWFGAVLSKDFPSTARPAMRSFAGGNICSVDAASIEILFALKRLCPILD
jgi:hypothetical protein